MIQPKFKKIVLLNETILDSTLEKDNTAIIRNFTETGIKILDADFGFAWWKSNEDKEYRLAYKSRSTPYDPPQPRKKAGNYMATKTKKPFFDSHVKTENYEFNIRKYLKSYIIIPIFYKDFMYGNLVFCYKKKHFFIQDEVDLAKVLGTSAAQTITIQRLILNEKENHILLEKQKAHTRALKEEKLKVESIAEAAHELRTPLAIMKGNVDLALKAKGKNLKLKSEKSALHAIDHEITHLSGIVSDLALLTSDGGSFKNKINRDAVDISELIIDTLKRFRNINPQKNISITAKMAKDIIIIGDKNYLERLFSNLIRNAISYGRQGGFIKVSALKKKDTLEVKIVDNGIGIGPEDLPRIFDRFYRVDKSHNSDGKRTGLGLAIAKWVTDVHGGKIFVESILGKGSVFTVSLPLRSN